MATKRFRKKRSRRLKKKTRNRKMIGGIMLKSGRICKKCNIGDLRCANLYQDDKNLGRFCRCSNCDFETLNDQPYYSMEEDMRTFTLGDGYDDQPFYDAIDSL